MRTFECLVGEERMQWSSNGSIFARPAYVAVIDVACDADFLELVRSALLAALLAVGPQALFGIVTVSHRIGIYDTQARKHRPFPPAPVPLPPVQGTGGSAAPAPLSRRTRLTPLLRTTPPPLQGDTPVVRYLRASADGLVDLSDALPLEARGPHTCPHVPKHHTQWIESM